jgi:bacterioferritin-associated ferredoxin
VRAATGAGDGCTACHRRLRRIIEGHAASCPVG